MNRLIMLIATLSLPAMAADWPMWRYDAGRTAFSREELPAELHLQWVRQYSQREPVWDDPLNQDLMPLDRVFEPVVLGSTLYIGFNDRDKVVALDIHTAAEKWTFYTDAPVRLPLAGTGNRLYFTSDDGYLYCLAADTGTLRWKFRGGPKDRKILGNKRLISSWPARGGVVLYGDVVYFAAGIWPFMGTFIYALNAETGSIVWRNEGTSADYQNQPHNSPAFAGVAPQGAMAAVADRLIIPGGRSVPACFDRLTGKLLYYHLALYNKSGGAFVAANERHFFNHYRDRDTDLYDLQSGKVVARRTGKYPVLARDAYYTSGDSIGILDAREPAKPQFSLKVDATGDLIGAGSRLYAGGDGQIAAVDVLVKPERALKTAWAQKVEGKVERLVAANGMLFAVTADGKLIAFGKERVPVKTHRDNAPPPSPPANGAAEARAILETTRVKNGFALVYGSGKADFLAALALLSNLDIVAVEPGAAKVAEMRRRLDNWHLPSKRVHVLEGSLNSFEAPPYLASLVIVGKASRPARDEALKNMVRSVRPYGGKLWLPAASKEAMVSRLLANTDGPKLSAHASKSGIVVSKDGPLPGAANWTHQYGNVANTVKSDDNLVKLPLGVLWFGGVPNVDVLPRHGHGPPEQIVDGRLIIEGVDALSARDVYTGRMLWKSPLDKAGTFKQYYDETHQLLPLKVITNQQHIPGANARGTNFVATTDWVYVLQGNRCQALDIETGEMKKTFSLPAESGAEPAEWGYIGVSGDRLIAGRDFVPFAVTFPETNLAPRKASTPPEARRSSLEERIGQQVIDTTSSRALVVMDRHSGSVKWTLKARYGFIHNAITASDKTLFCLDKLPPTLEKRLLRRGRQTPSDYRLLALDIETGRVLWEKNSNVFGSWLSYSQERDRLLQATRPSRDMLTDEIGDRMAVYVASTGTLVWDRPIKYNNPPILHHDEIITDNAAYKLATGERKLSINPLTGGQMPWSYARSYGCNYNIAGEHLLSFRSAAAGFYDLDMEGGTGNFGGFKSGCTSNLIAAGGLLNAPDYTRTCQCSYQNQTSLAFIHMPELEYWTTNDWKWNGKPVQRIGINLGAPGDRVAADGTLWLDFPSVGGKSPDLPIEFDAANTRPVRRNALTLQPNGSEWVAASALAGPLKLKITLSGDPATAALYTVKLHFAELENRKPGERVFNVRLQDREVLSSFDIVRAAGGADRPVIKTFAGIPVKDALTVECLPASPGGASPPVLSGIEVTLEK
ncbi:MAG: PQQ-binding-like beta-propeller repeat protein [Acidobacteria bacterium]|nr:PQQ-binding-like beta-propeller repeat protein [Acidobacteriota bacterium]